jgi:hypothetical protein
LVQDHIALGLGLAACQKGLSVGFTTAAPLVHELIEARDEKRLLRLQRQVAGYKLDTRKNPQGKIWIVSPAAFDSSPFSGSPNDSDMFTSCRQRVQAS